jgi:hypothetical protein
LPGRGARRRCPAGPRPRRTIATCRGRTSKVRRRPLGRIGPRQPVRRNLRLAEQTVPHDAEPAVSRRVISRLDYPRRRNGAILGPAEFDPRERDRRFPQGRGVQLALGRGDHRPLAAGLIRGKGPTLAVGQIHPLARRYLDLAQAEPLLQQVQPPQGETRLRLLLHLAVGPPGVGPRRQVCRLADELVQLRRRFRPRRFRRRGGANQQGGQQDESEGAIHGGSFPRFRATGGFVISTHSTPSRNRHSLPSRPFTVPRRLLPAARRLD